MTADRQSPVCAVTGSNGYVGGHLTRYLGDRGCDVVEWRRRAPADRSAVEFHLGQVVSREQLEGVTTLVHCAYDFTGRSWREVVATNVQGSETLLRAALAAGVPRIVFVSSISAFEGCRSMYGRAKLEIERAALSVGALVVRPGLVYSERPGGVFGGLVTQVRHRRVIPLPGGGRQPQYLVHSDDLAHLIERFARGQFDAPQEAVTLAHEEPRTMRGLITSIGDALGKRPIAVGVPWRATWLGLRALEALRLPTPFRSDSLIGMIHHNPSPSFALARRLEARCRPFAITPGMLS